MSSTMLPAVVLTPPAAVAMVVVQQHATTGWERLGLIALGIQWAYARWWAPAAAADVAPPPPPPPQPLQQQLPHVYGVPAPGFDASAPYWA
nr:unnamed protein product [Digitaria exilis]